MLHKNKNAPGPDGCTVHIIPQQSKGLFTVCDVHCQGRHIIEFRNLGFQGCKNFRPWASFGEKGLTTAERGFETEEIFTIIFLHYSNKLD